jgi:acetyl-CoA acetyltransferase
MMDEYAVESHRRAAFAQDNGHLDEIEPLYGDDGKVYAPTTACGAIRAWSGWRS